MHTQANAVVLRCSSVLLLAISKIPAPKKTNRLHNFFVYIIPLPFSALLDLLGSVQCAMVMSLLLVLHYFRAAAKWT